MGLFLPIIWGNKQIYFLSFRVKHMELESSKHQLHHSVGEDFVEIRVLRAVHVYDP